MEKALECIQGPFTVGLELLLRLFRRSLHRSGRRLGRLLLLAVPTIRFPLRSLLGLGLCQGGSLRRLHLGVPTGLLDRIRHFDLALGIHLEGDVLEDGDRLVLIIRFDKGAEGVFAGDVLGLQAVADLAEGVPHGSFGTNIVVVAGELAVTISGDGVVGHDLVPFNWLLVYIVI